MPANSSSFLDDLDMSDVDRLPNFEARMATVRASIAAIGADLPPWQPFAKGSQAAEAVETMCADRQLSPPVFDPSEKDPHKPATPSQDEAEDNSLGPRPIDYDLPDTTLPHWRQSREEAEGSLPLLSLLRPFRDCKPRQLSDLDTIPEVDESESVVSDPGLALPATSSRRRNYTWSCEEQAAKRGRWLLCARNCAKDLMHRRHHGGKTKPGESESEWAGRERTEADEQPVEEQTFSQADKSADEDEDEDETDEETYTERPVPLANLMLKNMWKGHKKPRYVLESSSVGLCIWRTINGLSGKIRYISPQKLSTRHARRRESHSE